MTYKLNKEDVYSDEFYGILVNFTDKVLFNYSINFIDYVIEYKEFLKKEKLEELRTDEEYLLEIISLGVFWNQYSILASKLPFFIASFSKKLNLWRKQYPKHKKNIDKMRGILYTLFYNPMNKQNEIIAHPNLENLKVLNNWLDASSEFKQEVIRFENWIKYLSTKSDIYVKDFIMKSIEAALKFELESVPVLGKFTSEVNEFLKHQYTKYMWREDIIFTARRQAEYHLNMVGAEIMNRAFRSKYEDTKRKVVLLPACMKEKGDDCKAININGDFKCTACSNTCKINKIDKIGRIKNYETCIIPHSSDFSTWLEKWSGNPEIGLVGVACVLNLLTGGYEAKALDIPIQCVFLDECSCKGHWSKEGKPTDLNERILNNMLFKKTLFMEHQLSRN